MKQYITSKQLKELSDRGKKRLLKWWKPQWGDLITDFSSALKGGYISVLDNSEVYSKETVYPLLSIGQMIEFLDEHSYGTDVYYSPEELRVFVWQKKDNNISQKTYEKKELCDALWEAVKEMLEKK